MSTCKVTVREGKAMEPCPRCGNRSRFIGHSRQVAEDYCEVWLSCAECHLDPHGPGEKLEDVWGGLVKENLMAAAGCWNDAAPRYEERSRKERDEDRD